jgi:ATP-dependent helicase/nuclease subunit A
MSVTSNYTLPFDEEPIAPRPPDPDERARSFAVDPHRNVVLEASAGTGKTRVLVDRYVNLLREGVDPANILAITFTRKAAAEMRQRILARVREAEALSEGDARRWRELRERAGEITISTIDAFCLSLLREFPLEADLEPGFAMADETEIPRFIEQALDRGLRLCRGLACRHEPIALVFAQLTDRSIRRGLEALLNRRLVARQALARFLQRGPADLTARDATRTGMSRLRDTFESVDGGAEAFLACGPLSQRRYEILRRDVQRLVAHEPLDELDPGWGRAALHRIRQHFFTKEGEPRKQLGPYYVKAHFASDGDYRRHLAGVTTLAVRIGDDIRAFQRDLNVVLSCGVWQIFQIVQREYDRTLEAHSALDFSEVLERAVQLLRQMDEFARSRYRLESRYHHLLVDEFQDTSRAQWELVSLLIKSWGEGFGLIEQAPLRPSVFIVGDRKQSIYGFRDAEVTVLRDAREYIAGLRPDEPAHQSIARSARAVPALLDFLNDVFEEVESVDRGDAFTYTDQDRYPTAHSSPDHESAREALGMVAGDSVEACANGVALEVERLLTSAQVRDRDTGMRREARNGDVAILFRSRESHREFETALESRGIPTYVYKGLGFFDADEIKDIVALLRYLANPDSDTRAAAFLRSRFIRLSDPALQALAPDIARAVNGLRPPAALAILDAEDQQVLSLARSGTARWLQLVDQLPPAELLDHVIAETAYAFELRGPRLEQARENLKKIRAIVRRVQNRGYATMSRLAEYLDRMSAGDEANAIIDAADAVSLMTVHAAKGLEFPIVFVVNVARGAGGPRPPIRVLIDDGTGEPSVSVGEFESEADDDLKARDREESKRLLYVALTRARDRLYLSSMIKDGWRPGSGGLGEVLPGSLGKLLVQAAAAADGQGLQWTGKSGTTHLFRACAAPPAIELSAATKKSGIELHGRPPDDRFEPLADRIEIERLAVTALVAREQTPQTSQAAPRFGAFSSRDAAATLAGRLVHRLLQFCGHSDDVEADNLEQIACSLVRPEELSGVADLSGTIEHAIRTYKAIRSREELSVLASDACLFEVPFSFRSAGASTILRGTIDCLTRHADGRITVFEFKTGRPTADHRTQLDIYLAAARTLFPGVPVEGRLIYCPQPSDHR